MLQKEKSSYFKSSKYGGKYAEFQKITPRVAGWSWKCEPLKNSPDGILPPRYILLTYGTTSCIKALGRPLASEVD
jgi:hypothetical protein